MVIQNLAQSSVTTQNVVLEVVEKLLARQIVEESRASNLVGCSGLVPPRGQDGNQGEDNNRWLCKIFHRQGSHQGGERL